MSLAVSVLSLLCLSPSIGAAPAVGGMPVEAVAPAGDWRIERSDLAEKLTPGTAVAVENLHGDLRVRSGGTGELSVHGVLQHAAGEPALRIELVAAGAGWLVRVAAPEAGAAREGPARRADLAVMLPADSPLTLRGAGGLVEARGFAAALSAETSTGEIRLRGSGAVGLRSERGSIRVAFHPTAPTTPSRLETVTGDIEVELPPGANAEAQLETQGTLTTDFSLEVERPRPLTKRARARIGRGGAELRLLSRTGDLRLLERLAAAPVPAPDRP